MKTTLTAMFAAGVFLSGCATNYKDVLSDSPHATISVEGAHGLFGGQTITALVFNRRDAYSRSNQEVITVPPGKVDLDVFWCNSYPPVIRVETRITFDAEAGRQYFISGKDA